MADISVEVKGMVLLKNWYEPYVKVELTKGAKGEYRWSVTCSHADPDNALAATKRLNADLNQIYGEGEKQV